jgi:hypothetical protein
MSKEKAPNVEGGVPEGKIGILKEFLEFLGETKKWWLAPIVIIMVLMGVIIVLTEGTAVAPLIYTIF